MLREVGLLGVENADNIDQQPQNLEAVEVNNLPLPQAPAVEPAPDEDPLLNPNGTPWHSIDAVKIEHNPDAFPTHSSLNWRGRTAAMHGMKRRIEYFYACFPMVEIAGMVEATNVGLMGK